MFERLLFEMYPVMNCKVVVKYKGALAHYHILTMDKNIYEAKLLRYDGKPAASPPSKIIIQKGFQHWAGSSEMQALKEEIENFIDKKIAKP